MSDGADKDTKVILQPGEHLDVPIEMLPLMDYDPKFFKVEVIEVPDDDAPSDDQVEDDR